MAQAIDYQFSIPLATEDELKLFLKKAWGVTIPDHQVCPHHTTPWRAFCDAYFAKSRIAVWKASRGFGGKSYLLALLGLTEAATLKADVNLLGGSGEQSTNVLEYTRQHWGHPSAPSDLLLGDVKRETRLIWGNKMKALLASSTSVRGPHIPRLRLDEIDEMELPILDASLGQTMAATDKDGKVVVPAQTVLSSTHQYPDGTMTEILKRARLRNWPIYEWCYRETCQPHGWLPVSEVAAKRDEVTSAMWETEYELQEPSPQSRAFLPVAVDAMFLPELGKFAGANGEYIEVEPPMAYCEQCREWAPLYAKVTGKSTCRVCGGKTKAARYATGADWATSRDWTIIVTLRCDVVPYRVVAFERCGRMLWPDMVAKYNERAARYPGRVGHDATGLGDVVDDYVNCESTGYQLVGRTRQELIAQYVKAVELGEILSPDIEYMHGEHRYCSTEDLRGGRSGHLPDSVCAMMIARDLAVERVYFG